MSDEVDNVANSDASNSGTPDQKVVVTETTAPPETLLVEGPTESATPSARRRRFDPQSPPWGLTTKAIIASAIIVLGAIVVWRFQFIITPLVLAAVFAYLLNPLISWVRRKTEITRPQAVLVVYALLLIL